MQLELDYRISIILKRIKRKNFHTCAFGFYHKHQLIQFNGNLPRGNSILAQGIKPYLRMID